MLRPVNFVLLGTVGVCAVWGAVIVLLALLVKGLLMEFGVTP